MMLRGVCILAVLSCTSLASERKFCLTTTPRWQPKNLNSGPVKVMRRDWLTHKLVGEIASILLHDVLGYNVSLVDDKDAYTSQVPQLIRDGQYDFDPEVWSSAAPVPVEGFVEELDSPSWLYHTAVGQSGWYVPVYTAANAGAGLPVSFFAHLQDSARVQQVYASAPQYPIPVRNESTVVMTTSCGAGCAMQILKGSAGNDAGIVEQQAQNLNLDIEVVYSTDAEKERFVWEAFARQKPVVYYMWRPTAMASDPLLPSQRIALPPWNAGCWDSNEKKAIDCDFPAVELMKLFKPNDDPDMSDAYQFFKGLALSDSDYAFLLEQVRNHQSLKEPVMLYQVACEWVKRHEAIWSNYTVNHVAFGAIPITHPCWVPFFILLVIFVFVFVLACYNFYVFGPGAQKHLRKFQAAANSHAKAIAPQLRQHISSIAALDQSGLLTALQSPKAGQSPQEGADDTQKSAGTSMLDIASFGKNYDVSGIKDALEKPFDGMGFFSTVRFEENFIKDSVDTHHKLLKCDTTHRENLGFSLARWLVYVASREVGHAIPTSLALALCSTLLSIVLTMMVHFYGGDTEDKIVQMGNSMSQLSSNLSLVPSFFLVSIVMHEVNRWKSIMTYGWSIQGKLHDLALSISGSMKLPVDIQTRKDTFKLYRWMSCLHLCHYRGLDPRLPTNAKDFCVLLSAVGLLVGDEAERAHTRENAMIETIATWVDNLCGEMIEKGILRGAAGFTVPGRLAALRHCNFESGCEYDARPPNSITSVLLSIVYLKMLYDVAHAPLTMHQSLWYDDFGTCINPMIFLSGFFFSFTYLAMLKILSTMNRGPYDPRGDCINPDTNLCESDNKMWVILRGGYELGVPTEDDIKNEKLKLLMRQASLEEEEGGGADLQGLQCLADVIEGV